MIKVYFDGASAGNPGYSGAGVYIKRDSGQEERHSLPLGILTNHEAEFKAFLYALELCIEKDYLSVSFRTDSQLIDRAVEKAFVKNSAFQQDLNNALKLIDKFQLFFLKWIPDKQNKNADILARKAIYMQKDHK
ncbi:ribonuclease HI [Scopulibacillus darangshiensis]|uniref:Ribonuclease HI n=1 Tax=Scopulibacillus darangshiensis TaxID=442528 RepID=A0A4R2NXZ4_9BACL|nr:reverse transcriptase-like protein [Scopulibacillus darangshiensis]TCP27050.1 ribonuclease HI [Scopulibacillus darangshiensis]